MNQKEKSNIINIITNAIISNKMYTLKDIDNTLWLKSFTEINTINKEIYDSLSNLNLYLKDMNKDNSKLFGIIKNIFWNKKEVNFYDLRETLIQVFFQIYMIIDKLTNLEKNISVVKENNKYNIERIRSYTLILEEVKKLLLFYRENDNTIIIEKNYIQEAIENIVKIKNISNTEIYNQRTIFNEMIFDIEDTIVSVNGLLWNYLNVEVSINLNNEKTKSIKSMLLTHKERLESILNAALKEKEEIEKKKNIDVFYKKIQEESKIFVNDLSWFLKN